MCIAEWIVKAFSAMQSPVTDIASKQVWSNVASLRRAGKRPALAASPFMGYLCLVPAYPLGHLQDLICRAFVCNMYTHLSLVEPLISRLGHIYPTLSVESRTSPATPCSKQSFVAVIGSFDLWIFDRSSCPSLPCSACSISPPRPRSGHR